MHRQSIAPNRASHVSQAAANAKLVEKKKEYDAVAALERGSQVLLDRIEGINEDCDVMAAAAQVSGEVLEQWPKMFQILQIFCKELMSNSVPSSDGIPVANRNQEDRPSHPTEVEGQVLVRVPIAELQEDTQ